MAAIIHFDMALGRKRNDAKEINRKLQKTKNKNKIKSILTTQSTSTIYSFYEADMKGVHICPECANICVGPYCDNNKCKHHWVKILKQERYV